MISRRTLSRRDGLCALHRMIIIVMVITIVVILYYNAVSKADPDALGRGSSRRPAGRARTGDV